MTAVRLLLALLVVVSVVPAAPGQARPDYSGKWILSLERSRIDRRIGAGLERGSIRIVHRDPAFSFERVFRANGRDDRASYALTIGGPEQTTDEKPITRHSRLAWENGTLVLEERLVAPQGAATNTVRYRLLDEGRTLEAHEVFRGPRLQYENVWVFVRS